MSFLRDLRGDVEANNELRTGSSGLLRAWFFDPGFRCVALARLAILLRKKGVVGRLCSRLVEMKLLSGFSVQISTDCVIGRRLRLPHPIGIVVGKGVVIGDDVTLYQNTTFGRASAQSSGYPRIGCGVTVYAGAVVVGDLVIGDKASVGANAVVTKSIPAGKSAVGVPAKVLDV